MAYWLGGTWNSDLGAQACFAIVWLGVAGQEENDGFAMLFYHIMKRGELKESWAAFENRFSGTGEAIGFADFSRSSPCDPLTAFYSTWQRPGRQVWGSIPVSWLPRRFRSARTASRVKSELSILTWDNTSRALSDRERG